MSRYSVALSALAFASMRDLVPLGSRRRGFTVPKFVSSLHSNLICRLR